MKFWMKFIKFLLKINRFLTKSLLFSPSFETNLNRCFCPLVIFCSFALLLRSRRRSAGCSYPLCVLHTCTAAVKFIPPVQIKFTATHARPQP